MTNIFEKIPHDFFKILTSKHKELFLDVMFHMDDILQNTIYYSREKVIDSLHTHITISQIPLEKEEFEFIDEEQLTKKTLIQAVLRQLEKKGWIIVELEDNFKQQIYFPNYVSSILNVLRTIDENQHSAYSRHVFTTYSALKMGLDYPEHAIEALETAWSATKGLHQDIQQTYFLLSDIYNKMNEEWTTNEMLVQHFDEYKEKIIDQVLFPLKTRDSLPRFKHSILQMLQEYQNEGFLDLLVTQNIEKFQNKEKTSKIQAEKQVFMYVNELIEFYRESDQMMQKIDDKKNRYITKSIGKIQYRLRSDFQLKDKLDRLITHIKNSKEEYFNLAELFEVKILNTDSLYEPRKKKKDITNRPRKKIQPPLLEEVFEKEQYEMLKKLVHTTYSTKKIDEFILSLLKNKTKITTADYEIDSYEKFILTIMATIRGYELSGIGYYAKIQTTYLQNNQYYLPNIIFIKESEDV